MMTGIFRIRRRAAGVTDRGLSTLAPMPRRPAAFFSPPAAPSSTTQMPCTEPPLRCSRRTILGGEIDRLGSFRGTQRPCCAAGGSRLVLDSLSFPSWEGYRT
jgi:hypothetical protein